MMRIVSALLIAACAIVDVGAATAPATTAAAAEEDFSVPFELVNGRIYVDGYVNGKGPYTFALDTGASGMGRADVRLVAEQSLKQVSQAQNSDGVTVSSINVVAVNSLRLGSLEKRNVELLSRDYNGNPRPDRPLIMGIFGAEFFADHLLAIDYPAKTLRFSRGELKAGEPGVLSYTGKFRIPVCFTGSCFTGFVDTGSDQGLVIPKSLVGQVRTSEPALVGTGTRANGVSSLYEMDLLEPVRVGGITASGLKIRYADPSPDEINMGAGFLKDYVLTIDSRNKLLRIERPASGERG